jgi:hypothetical protein
MRKITKRSAVIATASVLAVGTGTAAFAYASGWFNGSGTVYANSSTVQPVTTTVVLSDASQKLYPGKTVAISSVTVSNPNDYPVLITALTLDTLTSTKGAGCTKGNADVSFGAVPANTIIPAGQSPTSVNLGSVTMGGNGDVACAGGTFTFGVKMTGEIAPA